MLRRHLAVTGVVCVAVLLAGCQGVDKAKSATRSWSDKAQNAYVASLKDVDPALAKDKERVLKAGAQTCEDLSSGTPNDKLIENVTKRFSTDTVKIDSAKAVQIVDVVENKLCPVGK